MIPNRGGRQTTPAVFFAQAVKAFAWMICQHKDSKLFVHGRLSINPYKGKARDGQSIVT